jgi:hypothetical protein
MTGKINGYVGLLLSGWGLWAWKPGHQTRCWHTHTRGSQPLVFFHSSLGIFLAVRSSPSRYLMPCHEVHAYTVVMSLGKKSPIIRSPRYTEFYDHNVIKSSLLTYRIWRWMAKWNKFMWCYAITNLNTAPWIKRGAVKKDDVWLRYYVLL